MILAQGGQAPDTMLVAAGELEDKEWALMLDKLNHDKALVTAYVNKSQDAASFSFHVAREHTCTRHVLARAAVDLSPRTIDMSSSLWMPCLPTGDHGLHQHGG